jgi:hypothetical protein
MLIISQIDQNIVTNLCSYEIVGLYVISSYLQVRSCLKFHEIKKFCFTLQRVTYT